MRCRVARYSDGMSMADNVTESDTSLASVKAPFERIAFLFNDRPHGRLMVRITKAEGAEPAPASEPSPFDGDFDFSAEGVAESELVDAPKPVKGLHYHLHYEVGLAGHAQEGESTLSLAQAQELQQALVDAGVYLWDPEYGNDSSQPAAKWSLSVVLQEGVFTQNVRGGSDFPAGFPALIEAFHAAGVPEPEKPQPTPMPGAMGGGAFDPSQMLQAMQGMMSGGMPPARLQEMQEVMNEMKDNPDAFRARLKHEFLALDAAQQEELLNLLSATGMASRQWWEDFFRG